MDCCKSTRRKGGDTNKGIEIIGNELGLQYVSLARGGPLMTQGYSQRSRRVAGIYHRVINGSQILSQL